MIACAGAFAARAGDIYVWTDESGKTHLADSMPAKYRKAAAPGHGRDHALRSNSTWTKSPR